MRIKPSPGEPRFNAKLAEVKYLLCGKLRAAGIRDLTDEMLAVGRPV
jgi:hypothetical protein